MTTPNGKPVKIKENVDSRDAEPRSRFRLFQMSLRVRVVLGVALPILLALISLSLMRYQYERRLLEDQVQLTALQLGQVMVGSLRYAMLINNHEMLAQTLSDMGRLEAVQQVRIVGLDGRVKADSLNAENGMVHRRDDLGCKECHQFPVETRPRITRLSTSADVLRIAMPLINDSDCAGCHKEEGSHLGMLLVDMPAINIQESLRRILQINLAVSMGGTVIVTLGLYLLVHWLVVRRVEAFGPALAEFATGDFTTRLPSPSTPVDELDELAGAFNRMAGELDRRARQQEERSKLRQQAIAEERGRIARELHDGLAQLLGYVNTKAIAVRLMLKKRQLEAADQNLLQLEEASRSLFVDVREAILGLKVAGQGEVDLNTTLKDFTTQFSRLSDLPVELTLAPMVETLSLTAETKLQLLRIVQESLTNVRKHASATKVCVSLQINGKILEVTIRDNGQGFDLDCVPNNNRAHFGLSTMRERAEAINARFNLDSKPGDGTCIMICLPIKED